MKASASPSRSAFSLVELLLALAFFSIVLGLVSALLAAESRLRRSVETAGQISFLRDKARSVLAPGEAAVALAPDLSGTLLLFPAADWLPRKQEGGRRWEWRQEAEAGGGTWRILCEETMGGERIVTGYYEEFAE